MKTFLNTFFKEANKSQKNEDKNQPSNFNNVMEIIDDLIDKTIGARDVTKMKRNDNIQLISFMYKKGIFLTKGLVDKVAEKLGISPVTVYSYLDKIKKSK